MPRSSRIAIAQHIMRSLKIKGDTYNWLDKMNLSYIDNEYVDALIEQVSTHKRLASPRGRTELMAKKVLDTYVLLKK